MRRVALLALFIFFPVFAHATDSNWLKPYTVSNDIICPSAPDVCPATSTTVDIEFYVVATNVSIDFVSSDGTKTNFYQSASVTNPKPKIWDGTYLDGPSKGTFMPSGVYAVVVSATISGSKLVDSSRTITISSSDTPADTSDSTPPDTSSDTTDTTVTTTSSSSGGSSTTKTNYIPPPSALTVDAGGDQNATMEVPLHFSVRTTSKSGTADSSAKIEWGFGDGSEAEGTAVEKTYSYAGTYLVVVTATDGVATGRDEFTVTVRPGQVHILGIAGTGVMIANDASERLDLSGWALFAGTHSFRIPNGTILLPKTSVLFSSAITKLVMEQEVMLAYPDGDIASRYVSSPEPVEQPSSESASSNQVQTVESFSSPKTNVQSYDEAVIAPAAAPDTGVAAGAAVLPVPPLAAAVTAKTPATGLFHSVWSLGLLGVITLAGGAFILL